MSTLKGTSYLKELGNLFLQIKVTDPKGSAISLDEGIEKSIGLIEKCANANKKIMMIGNGGSASIASHISVDFWKNGGIRATAFNDSSLLTCVGNDFGYPYVFEKPIEMFSDPDDVLIAISSSGKSENILNGVKAAKSKKCPVITMSGFKPDNPLRKTGDVNFYVSAPIGAYGYVEIAHSSLCHCIVDLIIQRKTS